MKDLKGLAIEAKDGDIGEVNDFIFDDNAWTVRYLVVDTNRWLPGRKVLISPVVVCRADWEGKKLPVSLTREQVQNSPDIRVDEGLSAQDEIKYFDYYGWPYYWGAIWEHEGRDGLHRPRTAKSVTWTTSLSRIKHGSSVIWSLTREIGGPDKRSSSHPRGLPMSTGNIQTFTSICRARIDRKRPGVGS